MLLQRLNNKKFKDARSDALLAYRHQGITIEICGYKLNSSNVDVVAKCEDF